MAGARWCGFLIACAALAGAGCGADEESPREAYLSDVGTLCGEAETRVEDLPEPRTPDDFGPFLRDLTDLAEDEQERFEALEPPRSLREYHRRSIDEGEDVIAQLDTAADGIEDGADPMAVLRRLLPELAQATERANQEARKLGLDDCVTELPAAGAPPPSES